jgi:hypothetical protein
LAFVGRSLARRPTAALVLVSVRRRIIVRGGADPEVSAFDYRRRSKNGSAADRVIKQAA